MIAPIDLRLATPADMPFFYSATLQTYLYGSPHHRTIPAKVYFTEHARLLKKTVERPDAELLLAVLKEDPSVILGFLLWEPDIMHFTYVKRGFRQMGIARQLWTKADLISHYQISHKTYDFNKIINKKNGIIYNPYLIMG